MHTRARVNERMKNPSSVKISLDLRLSPWINWHRGLFDLSDPSPNIIRERRVASRRVELSSSCYVK